MDFEHLNHHFLNLKLKNVFLQVECKLFSEVGETLMLRTVRHDEMLVTDIVNRAREIFQRNTAGPQRSTIIKCFPVEKLQIKIESHCSLSVGESVVCCVGIWMCIRSTLIYWTVRTYWTSSKPNTHCRALLR